jgi:hypothetical protein
MVMSFCNVDCCGCGETDRARAPFPEDGDEGMLKGDSLSISIELLPLMADKFESRLRCSGGRLRGCKSRSLAFFLLEDDVGEAGVRSCLADVRLDRCLTSRAWGELAAARPPCWEDLLGDFVGPLSNEMGSECRVFVGADSSSSESSANFACLLDDFLEKNFIESAGSRPPSTGFPRCSLRCAACSGVAAANSGLGKLFGPDCVVCAAA